ncbi:MAG: hypothetical protein R3F31_10995 [Verrucomicrobiales bacterium]
MTPSIFPTPAAVIGLVCCLAAGLTGTALVAQEIPEDLIEDEHLREEYGVNQFTTPSIRKIFDDLQKLRPCPTTNSSVSHRSRLPKTEPSLPLLWDVSSRMDFVQSKPKNWATSRQWPGH